jgi:hypothetical protein
MVFFFKVLAVASLRLGPMCVLPIRGLQVAASCIRLRRDLAASPGVPTLGRTGVLFSFLLLFLDSRSARLVPAALETNSFSWLVSSWRPWDRRGGGSQIDHRWKYKSTFDAELVSEMSVTSGCESKMFEQETIVSSFRENFRWKLATAIPCFIFEFNTTKFLAVQGDHAQEGGVHKRTNGGVLLAVQYKKQMRSPMQLPFVKQTYTSM